MQKVVGIERTNERIMKVKIVIRDEIWENVLCYCPHAGRSVVENDEFYELLDRAVTSNKVLIGGDLNDLVGGEVCGFSEVHGGHGAGHQNDGVV